MPNPDKGHPLLNLLPVAAGVVCLGALCLWLSLGACTKLPERVPVAYGTPLVATPQKAVNPGTLIPGSGKPSALSGSWPQFRGPRRDNIADPSEKIAHPWPPQGPKVLWRIPVGEGHAGAAIRQGRVYVVDYDRDKQEDAIRCLSFDNGEEIWRYTYSVEVKRNHGMSRTVAAVNDQYVVAMGPKCHVHCLQADTGELVWKKDLVAECGTSVPDWYAGQCPLIDGERAILAPGAKPLMMAVDLATGNVIWQTSEGAGLQMSHSSIMPIEFGGQKQYVYCARKAAVGVSAEDGRLLWTKPDWKISIATVPSPVWLGDGRLFFSGGYNVGAAMARLKDEGGALTTEELYRLKPKVFGADQQTPIYYGEHMYGVIPSGELVCFNPDGTPAWSSGSEHRFG
ncbi:MAG: PQQ-like beta-propeller repeat protein, partial [Candidatus Sumerlaeota bacterium]|nr:PQQ-like beta-propeller repeat protein [Candidatus Sumerlaeota bacterium]